MKTCAPLLACCAAVLLAACADAIPSLDLSLVDDAAYSFDLPRLEPEAAQPGVCLASCGGRECGGDGCGGTCGQCPYSQECEPASGTCQDRCPPYPAAQAGEPCQGYKRCRVQGYECSHGAWVACDQGQWKWLPGTTPPECGEVTSPDV